MKNLLEIAMNDKDWRARRDAVQKIDYFSLSAVDKKRLQYVYLNDPNEHVRSAALERITAFDIGDRTGAAKTFTEKPQAIYEKHGALKDAKPMFQPNARGVFMVMKSRKELDGNDVFQVNMHAQSILRAESEEFKYAMGWWTKLPKTPARQKENLMYEVEEMDGANEEVQEWIANFEAYEGLVYIFTVESKLNLRTNETQPEGHIPVMAFNMSFGFRTMDDIIEDECVTYRVYFAFFENPDTVKAGSLLP